MKVEIKKISTDGEVVAGRPKVVERQFAFDLTDKTTTFGDIKAEYAELYCVNPQAIRFIFNGSELDDSALAVESLQKGQFSGNDFVVMLVESNMEIEVNAGDKTLSVLVAEGESIAELKQRLAYQLNIKAEALGLVRFGRALKDDETIGQFCNPSYVEDITAIIDFSQTEIKTVSEFLSKYQIKQKEATVGNIANALWLNDKNGDNHQATKAIVSSLPTFFAKKNIDIDIKDLEQQLKNTYQV